MKALQHMEMIDDEADMFGIRQVSVSILKNELEISPRFVRIVDAALAEDYSLWTLPALAFFRQGNNTQFNSRYSSHHFNLIPTLLCIYLGKIQNYTNAGIQHQSFILETSTTRKRLINRLLFLFRPSIKFVLYFCLLFYNFCLTI